MHHPAWSELAVSANAPLAAPCRLQKRRQPHLFPLAPGVASAKLHGPLGSFGWMGAAWPSAYISKRKELLGSAGSNGAAAIGNHGAFHITSGRDLSQASSVGVGDVGRAPGCSTEGVAKASGRGVRFDRNAAQACGPGAHQDRVSLVHDCCYAFSSVNSSIARGHDSSLRHKGSLRHTYAKEHRQSKSTRERGRGWWEVRP